MKINTPILSLEILTEEALDIYNGLDSRPFGEMLVRKVSQKLMGHPTRPDGGYYNGGGLYFAHRDYCGVGLFFFEGKFTLGEVNDGMGPHPIFVTFDSAEEFVVWLAKQSDQNMSLITGNQNVPFQFNNQTITRLRLEWYIEDDYDAGWNAYCGYLRKREGLQSDQH